jgi:hypothetical protein
MLGTTVYSRLQREINIHDNNGIVGKIYVFDKIFSINILIIIHILIYAVIKQQV